MQLKMPCTRQQIHIHDQQIMSMISDPVQNVTIPGIVDRITGYSINQLEWTDIEYFSP